MPTFHQSAILRAMMQPECYPHPVQAIELRETHISTVFLTGPFVYKIKKPVDLGFLDFSTLDKRRTCCRQEVTLNRRLSRDVYVAVVPVTLHGGRYQVDGTGPAVEFAVKMRQLADADAMHRRLKDASLTQGHLEALIRRLVDFYETTTADFSMATTAIPAWEENLQRMDGFARVWIDRRQYEFVHAATHAFARNRQSLFERRRTIKKSGTATGICAATTSTLPKTEFRSSTASNSIRTCAAWISSATWPSWPWTWRCAASGRRPHP